VLHDVITKQNRIFILFKHIQLITITKLQNAWIIYIYSLTIIVYIIFTIVL